jgi:hypothetical protein
MLKISPILFQYKESSKYVLISTATNGSPWNLPWRHREEQTLSLTPTIEEGALLMPASFPPRMVPFPLYMRLGETQGRSGLVWNILSPPGFEPRTVQLVPSSYNENTILLNSYSRIEIIKYRKLMFRYVRRNGILLNLNLSVHLGDLYLGKRKICSTRTWLQIMGLIKLFLYQILRNATITVIHYN